jgi:hypothetical protein
MWNRELREVVAEESRSVLVVHAVDMIIDEV